MNKKNGYTFVELLIVISIVLILAMMMIGILNPAALVNRGSDAQRKKDLNRIKVAFEEYFNDKGYYPNDVLLTNLKNKNNCDSTTVFAPYLIPWPCDPNGNPYLIYVENNEFRVITNLQNKSDKDIPDFWYEREDISIYGSSKDQVNYGVSSSNILWYDMVIDPICNTSQCNAYDGPNCEDRTDTGCIGDNCYFYTNGTCNPICKTPKCCPGGCE